MNEQVTPGCVLRMCVEVEVLKAIFSLLRHSVTKKPQCCGSVNIYLYI